MIAVAMIIAAEKLLPRPAIVARVVDFDIIAGLTDVFASFCCAQRSAVLFRTKTFS